jgi:hypothetical protein
VITLATKKVRSGELRRLYPGFNAVMDLLRDLRAPGVWEIPSSTRYSLSKKDPAVGSHANFGRMPLTC